LSHGFGAAAAVAGKAVDYAAAQRHRYCKQQGDRTVGQASSVQTHQFLSLLQGGQGNKTLLLNAGAFDMLPLQRPVFSATQLW